MSMINTRRSADRRTEGSLHRAGSVIPPGLYANEMGGWFEVRYSNLPDDPGYDQGAPGVGITWGREKWYVLANSKEHFWAQWPYSLFRNCTPVSPNKQALRLPGGGGGAQPEESK